MACADGGRLHIPSRVRNLSCSTFDVHLKQRPAQCSVVTMRLFREFQTSDDDPIRRNEPSPTKDEGDLFIHRPSPRKIRVLLDAENLPDNKTVPTQLFEALLRSERVFQLEVDVSIIGSTDGHAATRAGSLSIRDSTVDAGSFSYPGPQYTWSIHAAMPSTVVRSSTILGPFPAWTGFSKPPSPLREWWLLLCPKGTVASFMEW